ncbi:hypothetical protein [Streptomyces sp. NBC_00344]|uniref:hypothetical protein n=1 Tax=Streptomyces sp. NBC_00344 TaxID=2975720 RepID=UPI002E246DF0
MQKEQPGPATGPACVKAPKCGAPGPGSPSRISVPCPTLVLDYDDETFHPGQPRQFFELLRSRKEYRLMRAAAGAQLHCSPMAPPQHREVVFDWLEDALGRGDRR